MPCDFPSFHFFRFFFGVFSRAVLSRRLSTGPLEHPDVGHHLLVGAGDPLLALAPEVRSPGPVSDVAMEHPLKKMVFELKPEKGLIGL